MYYIFQAEQGTLDYTQILAAVAYFLFLLAICKGASWSAGRK